MIVPQSAAAQASAFWVTGAGQGEIRPAPLPHRGAEDLIIRTEFTGISRGTESLVFHGRVPTSEYQRMRAPFQEGEFPFPVKYGYINVGVVEEGPAELQGRHVFSLFPHQSRFVLPRAAAHVLPDNVPAQRAVLAANAETAINGCWDAAIQPGDRVVVIGAGTVGCLVAWLVSSISGVSCALSDINPKREAIAGALGLRFALASELSDDATVVIHASGSPAGLVRALEIAAPDATIVEMSWYGDREVALPLGGAFHSRRLTIKASQVGSIPPGQRDRWTFETRMQLALRTLADPVLDALITGESAFAELPAVMTRLSVDGGATLCHRIRY